MPGSDRMIVFALAFATALFPVAATVDAQTTCTDTSGPFGSLLRADEFAAAVQALPPAAFSTSPLPLQFPLPRKAFLTNLPAVSQQGTAANPGSPGTCEAQSFGYGLGSYTAAREPGGAPKWNPALPQYAASPAYLFALALADGKASCPKGGEALIHLSTLVARGAASLQEVPYLPNCPYMTTQIPEEQQFPYGYPEMQLFQIGSYATFNIGADPPAAVQLIKEFIANGQAVAFSGQVLCGYATNLQLQNGVIYETNTTPNGHGQLVVGYDDTIGMVGSQGALLVQNSFGTAWPASAGASPSPAPPGMVYWSYNSFEQTQLLAAVAYPRSPGPPTGTKLVGSANAPVASITQAFQWSPYSTPQTNYLILTHFFQDPVLLRTITMTEPGPSGATATAYYGQYISTGYSYLVRNDGKGFLPGTWAVTLEGTDVMNNPIIYTGSVVVSRPQPNMPPGASMAGQTITGSTGANAQVGF